MNEHDFDRDPFAEALRASLAAHAEDAPRGELIAERIIATAERDADEREPRRGWRTWTLPLVAAVAVGGVVAAAIAIEDFRPDSSTPPAGSTSASMLNSPAPTPSESVPTSSAPATPPAPPVSRQLTGVHIVDLTFVSEDEGWALGSADCTDGSGRCTAVLHTTDGMSWRPMATTPFNVEGVSSGCETRCVQSIRFATSTVGYVYGPDAFLMTTDGGKTWEPQDGGAIALETLDNNVIRVTSPHSGCPGPCDIHVETSAIGSSNWSPAELNAPMGSGAVELSRGGHNAYLLVTLNPAGGASEEFSTLYRSVDDGRTWTSSGEPCPQGSREIDSTSVAAGGGDRVSVLCMNRMNPQKLHVAASTDAGAHFATTDGQIPLEAANLLSGDPDTVLVAGGLGMARSVDGGQTWQPVEGVTGNVTFVGFESNTVGRAVTDDKTIWTTRDAGKSWQPVRFG